MSEMEIKARISARVNSKGFKDLGHKYDNERQSIYIKSVQ